jgi:hypothetical protein
MRCERANTPCLLTLPSSTVPACAPKEICVKRVAVERKRHTVLHSGGQGLCEGLPQEVALLSYPAQTWTGP